tara:strand:+ start:550 stop:1221 length:672 start_codon:yes stop_codon:yes gene_type:complete
MPINQDLLNGINAALGAAVTPSLTAASSTNDLYEAYVFSVVLEVAKSEGGTVAFSDMHGNTPSILLFRTGPSVLYHATQNYCHGIIQFAAKPTLELHQGVYARGISKVRHELDVSVIWKDEADTCRASQVDPRYNKVVLAAECKMYQTSYLTVKLGREFIGYATDLRGVTTSFVANKQANSLEKLLVQHKKNRALSVIPTNSTRVNQLKATIQTAFQDFKTKN